MDFPETPEALTNEWLSDVLGASVARYDVERFAEGMGVIGLVTRVHLEYAGTPGPETLIAKFAAPNPATRAVGTLYDMYGREHRFYSGLNRRVPIRTPRCYYSAFDAPSQNCVLLIEDLAQWRFGDQVRGASLEEARATLSAAAALHAALWNDPRTDPDLEWIPIHDNPAQCSGMQQGFTHGWPVVLRELSALVPVAARRSAGRFPEAVPKLLHEVCSAPLALVHADTRLDNLFFAEPLTHDAGVAYVDWQSVCWSAPEQDVAYFITQSLSNELRRVHAPALLRHYHAELGRRGVTAYDFELCQRRYRIAAVYLLAYAVTIAGTLDLGNERGKRMAAALLGRSLSAIDELDGFALL